MLTSRLVRVNPSNENKRATLQIGTRPVPPNGGWFGNVEFHAPAGTLERVNFVAHRRQFEMAGGDAAEAVMEDDQRFQRPNPARRQGTDFLFFADGVGP